MGCVCLAVGAAVTLHADAPQFGLLPLHTHLGFPFLLLALRLQAALEVVGFHLVTALLGVGFVALAVQVLRERVPEGEAPVYTSAKRLFGYSILYLFIVFGFLMGEHWLVQWGLVSL